MTVRFHMTQRNASIPFYFVDVFANRPLAGNPLAVVPDADDLDDKTMQRIAREFNQSETTFLLRPTKAADRRLRSFTSAGIEVFGAGHNALGAWWWLAESGALGAENGRRQFTQEIGDRVLPVEITFREGQPVNVAMAHAAPEFGRSCSDLQGLATALGTTSESFTRELPAQVVSTGAAHLLVPIQLRTVLDGLQPDPARLLPVLKEVGAQGCYAFCIDAFKPETIACARFFNPTVGILEDPATGSAAGPLACYLRAHNILKADGEYSIEQGHTVGRPSQIGVCIAANKISVIGVATVSAEGKLRVHPSTVTLVR
jgi:trans-2,3-dihydro-3-hydroxyanthranilate isomerase